MSRHPHAVRRTLARASAPSMMKLPELSLSGPECVGGGEDYEVGLPMARSDGNSEPEQVVAVGLLLQSSG